MWKQYEKCSTYRDEGRIEASIPWFQAVKFETSFSGPNSLLAEFSCAGACEAAHQLGALWTDGKKFLAYRKGTSDKEIIQPSFLAALWRFLPACSDFEIPGILITEIGTYGKIMTPVFRFADSGNHESDFHLIFDGHPQRIFELFINKDSFALQEVRSTFAISPTDQASLLSAVEHRFGKQHALVLLASQSELDRMPPIVVRCIYDKVELEADVRNKLKDWRI